ncbi:hypothetical protein L1049_004795 [Liquidambar formosana]|uniref:Fe2OG dioxygenase domain-containing protein n=1 Tax=Liquidambar formosana TaxID=63359 RepID=A0AAP0X109_LIQFO
MQKYHSIADVAIELKRVAARKMESGEEDRGGVKKSEEVNFCLDEMKEERIDEKMVRIDEKVMENEGNGGDCGGGGEVVEEDDSPNSEITDGGSQEVQPTLENIEICSNHEECETRSAQIKMTKGFVAKEPVKGHMVNVVRGLKLYEDMFNDSELSKLTDFVNELRVAGQNGELTGETFKIFNQQMKGNKRELIQFGVPIFGQIKGEAACKQLKNNIEPIPPLLENVIDHLVQWRLIPNRKPNSCIINFFDEGEYSQPYLKPPHLDQPISTLLLSESTMAFGCTLVSDNDGNYKAPLMLSLKEGSLLVMRGNSADTAAHVICPSPMKRVSITFFRVRPDTNQNQSLIISSPDRAMTLWQPGVGNPYAVPNGALNGYDTMDVIPKWGVLRAPVVMLAPVRPMVLSPKRMPQGGTGVFLPWTVGSRKHTKHLPPRAQKGRLLALPSPVETHVAETTSDSGISV